MLLEGIFLPLTTPFYPDGRVYLRKLEANVEHYSRTPVAGMLVLGDAGEADGLTDAETRAALEAAIALAGVEKVMVAGVSRGSVPATLELAGVAAAAGYDAVAIGVPRCVGEMPVSAPERLTYFRAVADQAGLPVVVLGAGLAADELAGLAGHPNVIGAVVDLSEEELAGLRAATAEVSRAVTVTSVFQAVTGRAVRAHEAPEPGAFVSAASLSGGGAALAVAPPKPALKTRVKRVGFQVLAARAESMLAAWQAGAAGALPRLAACAPQACYEVWQAFKDEDLPLAEEKQARLVAAARRMEGWSGVAAMKHGCDWNGYFGGRPRLPLIALDAEEMAGVERDLGGMRN